MILTTTLLIAQEGRVPLHVFMERLREFELQAQGRALLVHVSGNSLQVAVHPTDDELMRSVYAQEIARHEALLSSARLKRDQAEKQICATAAKLEELRETAGRLK